MKTRIILDLCGGTGAWGRPYQVAGYDYRLITWPKNDVRLYVPPRGVHGILAAPPCTQFSYAKHIHNCGKTPDFLTGLETVSACMRIILTARPVWWALENPVGHLSTWLGRPLFVFDPWEFGDPYSKRTAIWGRFNPPVKTESIAPAGLRDFSKLEAWELPNGPGKLKRSDRRSITPTGFANAFYEVNP